MDEKKEWLLQITSPTIAEVLGRFLEEQRMRIKPATFGKYEDIVYFFKESMNGYAYQSLDEEEEKLFDHFYNLKGEDHREFCDVFGPEKILENVSEFLNYFMTRKVICGKGLLKAAGTVIKRLTKWLAEHGHVDTEMAELYADEAGEASKELPAMEEFSYLLWRYAADQEEIDFEETAEGYFNVLRVENDRLHLADMYAKTLVVKLPEEITGKCKSGWSINLELGKTKDGWKILEVGNVYSKVR